MDGAVQVASPMHIDDTNGGRGTSYAYPASSIDKMVNVNKKQLDKSRQIAADIGSVSARKRMPDSELQKWMRSQTRGGSALPLRHSDAFARHESLIKGKRAVVYGSIKPTYEALLLAAGASSVHTVEYNEVRFESTVAPMTQSKAVEFDLARAARHDASTGAHDGAKGTGAGTIDEQGNASGDAASGNTEAPHSESSKIEPAPLFEVAVSASSFDHDGLGRYGDPLCPDGDLLAMDAAMSDLVPGGVLFLSVPVGPDAICWNLHRRYGRHRLPLLLEGWEILDAIDWRPEALDMPASVRKSYEPVFVLRKPVPEGDEPNSSSKEEFAESSTAQDVAAEGGVAGDTTGAATSTATATAAAAQASSRQTEVQADGDAQVSTQAVLQTDLDAELRDPAHPSPSPSPSPNAREDATVQPGGEQQPDSTASPPSASKKKKKCQRVALADGSLVIADLQCSAGAAAAGFLAAAFVASLVFVLLAPVEGCSRQRAAEPMRRGNHELGGKQSSEKDGHEEDAEQASGSGSGDGGTGASWRPAKRSRASSRARAHRRKDE